MLVAACTTHASTTVRVLYTSLHVSMPTVIVLHVCLRAVKHLMRALRRLHSTYTWLHAARKHTTTAERAGEGWCPYSDITLAIRRVRAASNGTIQKVMVIDTDVHQGNGHERDKLHFEDKHMFILDVYNAGAQATSAL
jgi:acetoin utilization deacetylase AcuC-like enzyme